MKAANPIHSNRWNKSMARKWLYGYENREVHLMPVMGFNNYNYAMDLRVYLVDALGVGSSTMNLKEYDELVVSLSESALTDIINALMIHRHTGIGNKYINYNEIMKIQEKVIASVSQYLSISEIYSFYKVLFDDVYRHLMATGVVKRIEPKNVQKQSSDGLAYDVFLTIEDKHLKSAIRKSGVIPLGWDFIAAFELRKDSHPVPGALEDGSPDKENKESSSIVALPTPVEFDRTADVVDKSLFKHTDELMYITVDRHLLNLSEKIRRSTV